MPLTQSTNDSAGFYAIQITIASVIIFCLVVKLGGKGDMSHVEYDGDLESSPNYTYYGAQVRIPKNLYIIII